MQYRPYHELQEACGLSNENAAILFEVDVTTIRRWKRGAYPASKSARMCLQSALDKKPVSLEW